MTNEMTTSKMSVLHDFIYNFKYLDEERFICKFVLPVNLEIEAFDIDLNVPSNIRITTYGKVVYDGDTSRFNMYNKRMLKTDVFKMGTEIEIIMKLYNKSSKPLTGRIHVTCYEFYDIHVPS